MTWYQRFGMVSAIHEVNQWERKDPFTPATPNWSEVQIYNANGIAIKKGTNGIGTTNEQEFKLDKTTINPKSTKQTE